MRAARHREFSISQGRESTSFNHELQSDAGFSRTSTYVARSPKVSKKGKSSRSFCEIVDTITGACTNCFAPRQSKTQEGHVKPSNDGCDISISSRLRGEPLKFSQRLTDHPIIHRDIKSSNILLTDQLRAKVADFGFARLAPDNTEATHVSTMVKGTAGYVDPEYMRTNQLTDRSDVYSFGVLLVELLTGRRPIERGRGRYQRLTTQWVKYLLTKLALLTFSRSCTRGVRRNYRVGAGAEEVPGRRRGGGDGRPDAEDQRSGGSHGEGDGAGGRVHCAGPRGAAFHAALRRGPLVHQARLPAGAAARHRRRRRRRSQSEAARRLHIRAVDHESEGLENGLSHCPIGTLVYEGTQGSGGSCTIRSSERAHSE